MSKSFGNTSYVLIIFSLKREEERKSITTLYTYMWLFILEWGKKTRLLKYPNYCRVHQSDFVIVNEFQDYQLSELKAN